MTAARLSLLLHQPGGMTVAEAAASAHERLRGMQVEAVASIDAMLARMAVLGRDPRPNQAALDELYVLANAVFGTAGLFGLGAVGDVAYSLCDLLDRLRASGAWRPSAIQVHLDGLALARRASGNTAALTKGLRRVASSIGWESGAATDPADRVPGG